MSDKNVHLRPVIEIDSVFCGRKGGCADCGG